MWDGVESAVPVVVLLSPQVIVYLSAPPPTVEIVNVTVVPEPAAVIFDVNVTPVSYTHLTLPTNREV